MDVEYLRKQNQQQQSLAQKVAFVKSENVSSLVVVVVVVGGNLV